MKLKKDRYAYRVIWSTEDNEYVGLCEEFPSLSWLAETPEAAFSGIREIVSEIITDMRKTGEKIPEPLALSELKEKSPFMNIIPSLYEKFPKSILKPSKIPKSISG